MSYARKGLERSYDDLAASLPPERRERAERTALAELIESDIERIADLPGPELAGELATLTLDELRAAHSVTQRLLRSKGN